MLYKKLGRDSVFGLLGAMDNQCRGGALVVLWFVGSLWLGPGRRRRRKSATMFQDELV